MYLLVDFLEGLVVPQEVLNLFSELLLDIIVSNEDPLQVHPLPLDLNPNLKSFLDFIEGIDPVSNDSSEEHRVLISLHVLESN